jgi:hypothetical protein
MSDKGATSHSEELKPLLLALGKVNFNLAGLEYRLRILTWVLIGGPEQRVGQCVTAELSFRNLVALAQSLHAIREPNSDVTKELEAILNECIRAEEMRNKFMHSNWGPSPRGGFVRIKATAKKGRGLQWQCEPTSEQAVEDAALALHRANDRLAAFMAAHPYAF